MAGERRDGGERSLLIVVLVIATLLIVSAVLLLGTQDDPPKKIDADRFVASTTPVPSSGPQRDQLLGECAQVQVVLAPITDFSVGGLASVPAGAPRPTGTEQVSCAFGAKGASFVASRFLGTTADAMGANIEAAGWTRDHAEVNHGLPVSLYTQKGSKQITVVDLGGGQVVVVYS